MTAGARLLLAVAERLVHDAGGEVAYCDTDSLFIVSHRARRPRALHQRSVRAARWASRGARVVVGRRSTRSSRDLAALKVFNLDGSSFKIEKENFDDERRPARGVVLRNAREIVLPFRDRRRRDADAGKDERAHHRAVSLARIRSIASGAGSARRGSTRSARCSVCRSTTPAWFELPATSQLTLTTRNLMDHYRKTCNPFDFLAVAQLAVPRLLRCCEAPRPSCLLYRDRARWAEQPWRCLSCGAPIDPYLADTEQPIFKTYRRVVASLAHAVELKRLGADGTEPAPGKMRGLTIPRPVHVTSIEHMGKEVIVDPTDTPEELTAEQLSATDPVIYRDARKMYDALRSASSRRRHFQSRAGSEGEPFGRQGVREPRNGPTPANDREDRSGAGAT